MRSTSCRDRADASTDDEVAHARAVTPGCAPELDQVHLNHAGASLPPQVVVDTQLEYLRSEATTGGYEVAAERAGDLDAVYGSIARLLGARPHEIARFENATAAWNAAFWSVPMKEGQRILVHDHEYGANTVAFLRAAEEYGVVVERVPSDDSGQVSVAAMADALSRRRRGVGVAHPRPDERRAGEPGRGDRRAGQVGRGAVPARRVPVGRTARPRRARRSAATSCRPRAASSCVDRAAPASSTSANRSSTGCAPPNPTITAPTSWRATATNSPPARSGSSTGSTTTPRGSGSVRRSSTHWAGASIASRRRSSSVQHELRERARRRRLPRVRPGGPAVRHRHGRQCPA